MLLGILRGACRFRFREGEGHFHGTQKRLLYHDQLTGHSRDHAMSNR